MAELEATEASLAGLKVVEAKGGGQEAARAAGAMVVVEVVMRAVKGEKVEEEAT